MRFLRHLGAATAVVGIVVVLGLAWAHFGPQTLAPGPQIGFRQEIVTGPGVGLRAGRRWRDTEWAAAENPDLG